MLGLGGRAATAEGQVAATGQAAAAVGQASSSGGGGRGLALGQAEASAVRYNLICPSLLLQKI